MAIQIFPEVIQVVTKQLITFDWTKEALVNRKSGMNGIIIGYSNAHGLCYLIKHEDGICAWYDPKELELI